MLFLRVSKKNIKQGLRFSEDYCPVALALRRRGYQNVRVGLGAIHLGDIGKKHLINTNGKIKRFITEFDLGRNVKPFWTILRMRKMYCTGLMHAV